MLEAEIMNEMPVAVWSGSFTVLGVELRCHVLSDGQRIIEQDSVHRFFDALANTSDFFTNTEANSLAAFYRWQKGE